MFMFSPNATTRKFNSLVGSVELLITEEMAWLENHEAPQEVIDLFTTRIKEGKENKALSDTDFTCHQLMTSQLVNFWKLACLSHELSEVKREGKAWISNIVEKAEQDFKKISDNIQKDKKALEYLLKLRETNLVGINEEWAKVNAEVEGIKRRLALMVDPNENFDELDWGDVPTPTPRAVETRAVEKSPVQSPKLITARA